MNTIELDIVTPNGSVFHEEAAELVVVDTTDGERGFMARHTPTVAPLKIGKLHVRTTKETEYFAISEGFVEVRPEKVTVLVQSAEHVDDIDTERAKAARDRAKQLLEQSKNEDIDFKRADRALRRAINRIDVAKFR